MRKYRLVYGEKQQHLDRLLPIVNCEREVSIILPTYNEQENITKLINAIFNHLHGGLFEIIVVDDNSSDGTSSIIDELAKNDERVVALHRYGKGNIFTAIRDGIKIARGEIVVTMDADFSHPPAKISELIDYLGVYDLVSGSRFIKGGGVNAPLSRTKYASLFLNEILRFILGIKQKDITGGFHAIKKNKFNELRFKYPSVWGEFDLELFYRAKQKKFKIKEIPFVYNYRKEGKSKSKISIYVWIYIIRTLKLKLLG